MKKITLLCVALFMSIYINGMTNNTNSATNTANTEVQRVRIDFVSPDKYTRHLLLGFTPDNAATDGFDYGYDGVNMDSFVNDLNWLIEDDRYVIQSVGAFDKTKLYPFGMFLTDSGEIQISLTALENFDSPIDVFIYDDLLDIYTQINDTNYISNLNNGDYINRFYIAFINANENELLSTTKSELQNTIVKYLSSTKELYINTASINNVKQLHIFNLLGQRISSLNNINSTEIKIPMNNFTTNYAMVNIETDYGIITKKIIIY